VIPGPKSARRVSESLIYSATHVRCMYILTPYTQQRISPILFPEINVGCQKVSYILPRWTVYLYSHTLHTVENSMIPGPKSECRVSESLIYSTAHGLNVYILTPYTRSRISPILPPKMCVGCQNTARVLYVYVLTPSTFCEFRRSYLQKCV